MISEVFNMDCLEYMKTIPDSFFDLAICDPPYGDPANVIGGGSGLAAGSIDTNRGGGKAPHPGRHMVEKILCGTGSDRGSTATRWGGANRWRPRRGISLNYRLSHGTWLRQRSFSMNCFEYRKIRLSGAATTLNCHRQGAFLSGAN